MAYAAPVAAMRLLLDLAGFARLSETERFRDASVDVATTVLDEAGRLVANRLAPLNREGDRHPARLEGGVVRTSPGFQEAYAEIAAGGWIGMAADPAHGGMGLPMSLVSCVNEMLASGCLALQLCPLLTLGQIEALERHASEEIKAVYLPKLLTGAWTGTMNLTEPQAGSDVGALAARAEPGEGGTYRITGQKIYITWGDHDLAENVCHLVLARLPEAPAGTRGISLFLVPKRLPDASGEAGAPNAVRVLSLEHKMGLHASPTAVMSYEGATGWLVGREHGGMPAMFTMMNNARLGVGVQGVGVAEAAVQAAHAFARERQQGRTTTGETAIVGHPDVRRMLTTMRALTWCARAIAIECAIAGDFAVATGSESASARAGFLTPIAKAFGTDIGCEVASLAIQVHGGMGYVEETGIAQLYRDVRVTPIYEGTNGVQAADLVMRKLADGGSAAREVLGDVFKTAAAVPELGADLHRAAEAVRATTEWLVAAPTADRLAGSSPYLRAYALVLGGHALLRTAAAAPEHAGLARFFVRQILPGAVPLLAAAREGDAALAMAG